MVINIPSAVELMFANDVQYSFAFEAGWRSSRNTVDYLSVGSNAPKDKQEKPEGQMFGL